MSVGSKERRKAAKDHVCEECRRTIPKGALHFWYSGLCDGSWWTARLCARCERSWARAHARGALVGNCEDDAFCSFGDLAGWLREWRCDRYAYAWDSARPVTLRELVRLRRDFRRRYNEARPHLVRS